MHERTRRRGISQAKRNRSNRSRLFTTNHGGLVLSLWIKSVSLKVVPRSTRHCGLVLSLWITSVSLNVVPRSISHGAFVLSLCFTSVSPKSKSGTVKVACGLGIYSDSTSTVRDWCTLNTFFFFILTWIYLLVVTENGKQFWYTCCMILKSKV